MGPRLYLLKVSYPFCMLVNVNKANMLQVDYMPVGLIDVPLWQYHFKLTHDSIVQYCTTMCLRKVPTFKLSVTLANLNRCLKFFTAGKRMKFATKSIRQYPPHLSHVATLSWEIKFIFAHIQPAAAISVGDWRDERPCLSAYVWAPTEGTAWDPLKYRCQFYPAKSWDISLLWRENRMILASTILSQYTHVTDRRPTDNISWQQLNCAMQL